MRAAKISAVAAFLLLVALLPLALGDFRTLQFAYVGIYFAAILGLQLLTGYTGQISLGHGAFMAVGGYTTAILAAKEGIGYLWTLPVAAVVAGAAGLAVGIPALRLSGLYLALATFGLAVATPALLARFPGLTGGSTGLSFPLVGGTLGLSANRWLYYLSWAVALLGLAAAWLVVRGRLGRAFQAIRESEVAATAFGVDPRRHKTLAFALSAAFAGVAGSLYAIANLSYVSPDTFPVGLSILLVVGAVASGLGSLWGVVFGALLLEFLGFYSPGIARGLNRVLHTGFDPTSA